MIQYQYLAVNDKGKKCRGTLSAESPRAARAQLLGQQLTPISLTPESNSSRGFSLSLGRSQDNIGGNDLVLLTRQLSTLVAAALPLEEALLALAQQSEKPRHRAVLEQVRNKILEGLPLADALASFPKTFTSLFRTMVAAGEASGHLDKVLLRLADNAEQSQKLKSKMLQAMIYPLVLTVVAIAVVAILLTAVVPKVIEQFIHMQQALPLSTRLLISLSDALRDFGLWALLALLLMALGVRQWLKPADNLMWWHKKMLHLPSIGRVVLDLNLARYARTLSILNASAVPLLEAMHISASVLANNYARQQLVEASEKVREGGRLASALEHTGLLSPMMRHMITSGENSGELDSMLERAADIQENAFVSRMTIALALFEPLLVVTMATVVLFIILAILQPILQLNSMMG
ncbi:type II secretion system inner membrane protein GspF [Yersinia artesiana]|uniref:type II secretion system inner membrane protein GspF n=1 Tax=Yersinia artesiana TaxID=2890315 RepID=UPI0015829F85|nr:type II secretion system inner membrane protein GspF [Yersinia artesiana]